MIGDSLPKAIGPDLNGSIGSVPGTDSPGAAKYSELAKKAGFESGPYGPESYDSAALIMLAMEKSKSTVSNVFKKSVDILFLVHIVIGEKWECGHLYGYCVKMWTFYLVHIVLGEKWECKMLWMGDFWNKKCPHFFSFKGKSCEQRSWIFLNFADIFYVDFPQKCCESSFSTFFM